MYRGNIELQTLRNNAYRKVLYTGEPLQIVLMNIAPGHSVPAETHHGVEQFVRVESGIALVKIGAKTFRLNGEKGGAIVIPHDKRHTILNPSKTKNLKLYTIYSSPVH